MKQMGLDRILVNESALPRHSGLSRGDTDSDPLRIVDIVSRAREETSSLAGLARIVVVHSCVRTLVAVPLVIARTTTTPTAVNVAHAIQRFVRLGPRLTLGV